MGRKKKEAEPIFKPLEVTAPPPPPPVKPLANYGADETPRACVHCGCKDSKVDRTRDTGRIRTRCRRCNGCGLGFVTREMMR